MNKQWLKNILLVGTLVSSQWIAPAILNASTQIVFASQEKIDASLLDSIEKGNKETFIILLNDNELSSENEEQDVVDALKEKAEVSQSRIIQFLKDQQEKGQVVSFESNYIINSISVLGNSSLIKELSDFSEVKKIIRNEVVFESIPMKVNLAERILMNSTSTAYIPWNLKALSVDKVPSTISGKGVVVGIIDSGVDITHPAVKSRWRGNHGDPSLSWYDATAEQTKMPTDSTGHGTHVAGTILGTDHTGKTRLGIAQDAEWIAARVFDRDGETTLQTLIEAGEWMLAPKDSKGVAHPEARPNVINNSWGGNSDNEFYRTIIQRWREAGILPVFSAGNVSSANRGGEGSIGTPASYPESFAVGALRRDDHVAKFSLQGPSKITDEIKPDISAPGVNIRSSIPGGQYELRSGTSMAGPHISGIAALIYSVNKTLTVDQVEEIIKQSATPLTDSDHVSTPNHAYGYGKANAYLAVKLAQQKLDGEDFSLVDVEGSVFVDEKDTDKPIIEHTPISTMYKVYPFDIQVNVTDDSGIQTVKMYYKLDASQEFKSKEFSLVKGSKKSGTYEVTIEPSDLAGDKITYYIEATDLSNKTTRTENKEAAIQSGVSIGYTQDFETNLDGIELGGKTPMWEWGNPAKGVGPEAKSNRLIGTNLKGSYTGLKDSLFVLPAVDLTSTEKRAALTFDQWYQLGNGEAAFFDTAEIWIGEIPEEEQSKEKIQYKLIKSYKNSSREWKNEYIDLGAYQGKKIFIMFAIRYGGWSKQEEAGWYIDNIKIEEASKEVPETPHKDITFRYETNGKVTLDFTPVNNVKIDGYELYRSNTKDGEYKKVNTATGKYSVTLNDYPSPQVGTYYYYAVSKIGEQRSERSEIFSHTFTTGKEVKKFTFETGDEGWTSSKDANSSPKKEEWTRGSIDMEKTAENYGSGPTSYQSKAKNPDSPTVWGTELNTYRKTKSDYELVSPTIDLSSLRKAKLYYQNWFNTTGRRENNDYGDYNEDLGELYFSLDNGKNWEKVFDLDKDSIDTNTRELTKRSPNAWSLDQHEIPSKYLTNQFKMKFVLHTGTDNYDSKSGGWYIDDVAIYDMDESISAESPIAQVFHENFHLMNSLNQVSDRDDESYKPAEGIVRVKETGVTVPLELGSGRFGFKHAKGDYTISIQVPGYETKEISVSLNELKHTMAPLVLTKSKGVHVRGQIESKKELNHLSVSLYKNEELLPKYKLSTKSFDFENVELGEYTLIIEADGYKPYKKTVNVEKNDVQLSEPIILEEVKESDNIEKSFDSGTPNAYVANVVPNRSLGVKFTADKLSRLTNAKFYIYSNGNTVAGKKYQVTVYDKNLPDGYPGRILYGPKETTITTENGWNEIVFDEPIYVEGDFFVSYTQLEQDDHHYPQIGLDGTVQGAGNSYKLINGAWNEPDDTGAFMIRSSLQPLEVVKTDNPPKEDEEVDKPKEGSDTSSTSPDKDSSSSSSNDHSNDNSSSDNSQDIPLPDDNQTNHTIDAWLKSIKDWIEPKDKISIGWNKLQDGSWKYGNDKGEALRSQWVKDGKQWYYLKEDGMMASDEWIFVNGHWFFTYQNGSLAENTWLYINNQWFYAKSGGYIAENEWIFEKGKLYFVQNGGYLVQHSWKYIQGKWYYFEHSGSLLLNAITPDGYKVDQNGEWIQ